MQFILYFFVSTPLSAAVLECSIDYVIKNASPELSREWLVQKHMLHSMVLRTHWINILHIYYKHVPDNCIVSYSYTVIASISPGNNVSGLLFSQHASLYIQGWFVIAIISNRIGSSFLLTNAIFFPLELYRASAWSTNKQQYEWTVFIIFRYYDPGKLEMTSL